MNGHYLSAGGGGGWRIFIIIFFFSFFFFFFGGGGGGGLGSCHELKLGPVGGGGGRVKYRFVLFCGWAHKIKCYIFSLDLG